MSAEILKHKLDDLRVAALHYGALTMTPHVLGQSRSLRQDVAEIELAEQKLRVAASAYYIAAQPTPADALRTANLVDDDETFGATYGENR